MFSQAHLILHLIMKTNQKAKMYFGRIKIRCTIENGDNSYSMTFNTLKSYKEILNDYYHYKFLLLAVLNSLVANTCQNIQ